MTLAAILKADYAHLTYNGRVLSSGDWVDLKNYVEERFALPFDLIVERVEVSSIELI